MNEDKENKFNELIQKYQEDQLSGRLKELMDQWYASLESDQADNWTPVELQDLRNRIMLQLPSGKARIVSLRFHWIAAAAVLLAALAITFYFYRRESIVNEIDIAPGKNKATLTFDGREISLDAAQSGIVISDEIIRYNNGKKVEGIGVKAEEHVVRQFVLSTPRGGQYQVILSDGTKVWLNAQSTLKYPSAFAADRRLVELDGEAYFLVNSKGDASEGSNPFTVRSRGQDVDVLGTEFNLMAYENEDAVKTTLISGAVKVSVASAGKIKGNMGFQQTLLLPGEETRFSEGIIKKQKADIASAIAWKDGKFHFYHTDLKGVMRQLARWYGVEVDYDSLPNEKFNGTLKRSMPLSEVINTIEVTSNLTFKQEGRRLVLMK